MMRLFFVLAVACLALGADARLTAKKARHLQNYNYGYNNYNANNANGYNQNYNNGNNNNGNNGNNYNNNNNNNNAQNYNQNGNNQNNNGQNNNGQNNNGQGDQADYQNDNGNYDDADQAEDYNGGEEAAEEYYDEEDFYAESDTESAGDDLYTDDFQFDVAHYKKLLEVHDMMEFYRLLAAILGFVILSMSLYICYLRRIVTIALERPSLEKPLSPDQPYKLAGKTTLA